MTTIPKRLTLAEYLVYDDDVDTRYELVAGRLVEMPPESDLNNVIAIALMFAFGRFISPYLLRRGTEIVVSGAQTTVRVPDLIVLTPELAASLQGAARSTILLDMPPPALAVEVVSPGKDNENRDYRYKRSEYAARSISEYWIVDPMREQVVVLSLVDGLYKETSFKDDEKIVSAIFPELMMTAQQVLSPASAE